VQELLRAGQQAQPRLAGLVVVAADEGVAERVERPRRRAAGGAAEPGGDAGAQLGGGLAAEGEHEHLLGAQTALLDPSTTASTSVVVLPVPGPASTSSGPAGWSTTSCCDASSVGTGAAVATPRTSWKSGASATV
jgi:hypothetical protein